VPHSTELESSHQVSPAITVWLFCDLKNKNMPHKLMILFDIVGTHCSSVVLNDGVHLRAMHDSQAMKTHSVQWGWTWHRTGLIDTAMTPTQYMRMLRYTEAFWYAYGHSKAKATSQWWGWDLSYYLTTTDHRYLLCTLVTVTHLWRRWLSLDSQLMQLPSPTFSAKCAWG
jgi:hypothetical protein